MNKKYLLVLNAGSSSLKYSVFRDDNATLVNITKGNINKDPDSNFSDIFHKELVDKLSDINESNIIAIAHRVVHGGKKFINPTKIDNLVIEEFRKLISLAPLHEPHAIEVIELCQRLFPGVQQVACFDTMYHRTQSSLEYMFALPRNLTEQGIIRYGFHGLSYEFVAQNLLNILGDEAKGRVITLHLGNGSSICAMKNLKSVASSMGFTALDGLMMGTRCGNIDPGVILYLLENGYDLKQVTKLLYNESGLKGVSGISNDVLTLTQSTSPNAKEALDLYCYRAAKNLGSLIPALNGLDIIVFTAGIGSNSPLIREKICSYLTCLGLEIDQKLNSESSFCISTSNSKIKILVVKTDEELMMAQHAINLSR